MRVIDVGHKKPVNGLSFSPTGEDLVVAMLNRDPAVHALSADRAPVTLRGGTAASPFHLAYTAGLVFTVNYQGRIGFDPTTGAVVSVGPTDPSVPGPCGGFAASADGTRLVTAHSNGIVWLAGWNATAGAWERTWLLSQGPSSIPAFAPNGDRIAQVGCLTSGRFAYHLILRDAASGELVGRGEYPYTMLARPHYRPDGRQVVAAHDMKLVVWDTIMPAKPQLVRNDSKYKFTAAAYHPSGRYLFTTSYDATVSVWDTDSWARVKRFDWDIGRLRSVAVSPDGLLAAAGSDRGRVVVWDVDV